MKKRLMVGGGWLMVMLCAGCAYTSVKRTADGVEGKRIAVLYPFDLGSLKISTTNETWELTGYRTDGGASNVADIAAAVTAAAVQAAK